MSRLLPILLFLVSFQHVQAQSLGEQDLFENENHAILTEYEQRYQDGNDPEFTIGREYLRIVVEDSITQKIELASSIYYWGLNANDIERDAEALEEELQYIEAIMDEDRFEYLQTLFEQRDPQLFKELKTFWIEYDFSPGTVFNERLIEHVERINFARKNYIENNRNVYETDDRGLTYVKFGQPDRVFEGTLDVDLLNVEQFCRAFDRCLSIELFNFLFEIDPEPEYEIWVYRDLLNSRKKNAVFLFAKTMGHEFKRYQTIEELIPARAKSKEIGSVSGGMALSWIYYRQLMGVDPYFSETYAFVNEKFYRDNAGLGAQQGFLVEREVAWNTRQLTNDIPRQESTIERMVYSVPLEYYVYRRFNENGRNNYAVFLESTRTQDFDERFAFSEGVESMLGREGDYELIQGVRLLDENNDELGQVREIVPNNLQYEEEPVIGQSVFMVSGSSLIRSVQLFSELWKQRVGETDPALIGLNRDILDLPDPLIKDNTTLTVSDLIIGYGLDYELLDDRPFPFYVKNNRQIPQGEVIAINVGVANLSGNNPGVRIEYSVQSRNRGLNRLFQNEFNTRINFQIPTDSPILVENLEIETEPLEPGNYVLTITFTDSNNGESVEKKLDFEVIDNPDNRLVTGDG